VRATLSVAMVLAACTSFAGAEPPDGGDIVDPGAVADAKVARSSEPDLVDVVDPGAVADAKIAGVVEPDDGEIFGPPGAMVDAKTAGIAADDTLETDPGAVADTKVAPADARAAHKAAPARVRARDGRTILNLNAARDAKK
jgi:hypothetical protein